MSYPDGYIDPSLMGLGTGFPGMQYPNGFGMQIPMDFNCNIAPQYSMSFNGGSAVLNNGNTLPPAFQNDNFPLPLNGGFNMPIGDSFNFSSSSSSTKDDATDEEKEELKKYKKLLTNIKNNAEKYCKNKNEAEKLKNTLQEALDTKGTTIEKLSALRIAKKNLNKNVLGKALLDRADSETPTSSPFDLPKEQKDALDKSLSNFRNGKIITKTTVTGEDGKSKEQAVNNIPIAKENLIGAIGYYSGKCTNGFIGTIINNAKGDSDQAKSNAEYMKEIVTTLLEIADNYQDIFVVEEARMNLQFALDDAFIKETKDGVDTFKFDESKADALKNSFNKLYITIKLVEAKKIQEEINENSKDLDLPKDAVINEVKNQIKNEKLGSVADIDKMINEVKIEEVEVKEPEDISDKTPKEQLDFLAKEGRLVKDGENYKTKLPDGATGIAQKTYKVEGTGEDAKIVEVGSNKEASADDIREYARTAMRIKHMLDNGQIAALTPNANGVQTYISKNINPETGREEYYVIKDNKLIKLKENYAISTNGYIFKPGEQGTICSIDQIDEKLPGDAIADDLTPPQKPNNANFEKNLEKLGLKQSTEDSTIYKRTIGSTYVETYKVDKENCTITRLDQSGKECSTAVLTDKNIAQFEFAYKVLSGIRGLSHEKDKNGCVYYTEDSSGDGRTSHTNKYKYDTKTGKLYYVYGDKEEEVTSETLAKTAGRQIAIDLLDHTSDSELANFQSYVDLMLNKDVIKDEDLLKVIVAYENKRDGAHESFFDQISNEGDTLTNKKARELMIRLLDAAEKSPNAANLKDEINKMRQGVENFKDDNDDFTDSGFGEDFDALMDKIINGTES